MIIRALFFFCVIILFSCSEIELVIKESGSTNKLKNKTLIFDPGILKNLGKGSSRKNNIESVKVCLDSGIIPIPNIIIGFPEETFESVRNTILALKELKIHAKPHFATAYPGSEWFTVYRKQIEEQYKGQGKKQGLHDDLEAYILDLGDATRVSAVISKNFNAPSVVMANAMQTTVIIITFDVFQ